VTDHIVPHIHKYLMGEKSVSTAALTQAINRFDEVMQKQFSEDHEPRSEKELKLYPSEAGKCERATFYKALGIPGEPLQADTRFKFAMGDLLELAVIYVLQNCKEIAVYDNNVKHAMWIGRRRWRGATDGILKAVDGKRRNLEVKSMSGFGFKATKRKGVDDKFGYLTQACIYTRYLVQNKLIDVPETVFLLIDRDTMHFHEETVRFDTFELAQDADAKFNRILDAIKAKKVPARPYSLEKGKLGLNCKYCDLKYTCWTTPHQAVKFNENQEPVYRLPPTEYLNMIIDRGKPNWVLVGDSK